jgi:glycosyltransferase involved in cell wall biosynthesis
MPKISVIIPTYNSANYLPEAIESVLAQTYKNFEIVVIDDGSTDNTKEVVVPYLDQIVFLETENGGPAKARNHGIRKSSGEYVAFLDADDIWCPDKLERQLAYFSKNPHYHLVFSDAYETGVNNLQKDKLFFSILGRVKPMAGFVFSELLGGNFIYIPSVIVKRDCFEKVGLFDENCELWQGYDLWLRITFKYQIGFVNAPLFFRRRHEGNRFYNSD